MRCYLCSPGGTSAWSARSAPAIGYARKRATANCSFVVGAAQDLPLPDRSFDVVASSLAAHHIPDTARQDAFGEMYRVLRPGGALLVADFRPSRRRHSLHSGVTASRHGSAVPFEGLAAAAGLRIEACDLPLLRYVRAIRPGAS